MGKNKTTQFKNLNDQQKKALLNVENPVFILAGAGTGKTRVLTHKIFHLLQNYSYKEENILAVTFTNKAAREMQSRVTQLAYQAKMNIKGSWIRTFHSACLQILINHFDVLGFKKNFTIYDTEDSTKLIQEIVKADSSFQFNEYPRNLVRRLSFYKNQFLLPKDLYALAEEKADRNLLSLAKLYSSYEQKLLQYNSLDFDNLILKILVLFQDHSDILKKYQEDFQYILVDEFQDINTPQYKLVKLLSQGHNKLTVVGDDDQSIYSWRGADVSNMNRFLKDYKSVSLVKLEQNYRSPNVILKAAHSLIINNSNRLDKTLWSDNAKNNLISYFPAYNSQEEANWVVSKILELQEKENVSLREIAILYRVNSRSRLLEETLRKRNIPYRIYGNVQFYERMEIKDILAFFSYVINPSNEMAIKRILKSMNFRIGAKSLEKLEIFKKENNLSFNEAIDLSLKQDIFRKNIQNRFNEFLKFLKIFQEIPKDLLLTDIFNFIIDKSGYLEYIKYHYENYQERYDNIDEFYKSLENFQAYNEDPSLENYMKEMFFTQDQDKKEEQDSVALMTLHHSKGLEFNYVFITAVVQGILPHQRSNISEESLSEERRLFYVGITRTQKKCFISSFIKERNGFNDQFFPSSIFLKEISPECIEYLRSTDELQSNLSNREMEVYTAFRQKNLWIQNQMKGLAEKNRNNLADKNQIKDISDIAVGDLVEHKEFGLCKILDIKETKTGSTVSVRIEKDKTELILLFKYAHLYKI